MTSLNVAVVIFSKEASQESFTVLNHPTWGPLSHTLGHVTDWWKLNRKAVKTGNGEN